MKADHPRPMSLYLADGTLVASLPHRENLIGEYAPELGNRTLPAPGDDVRMVDHATGDGGRQAFALGRTGRFPLLVGVPNDEELALAAWRENSIMVVLGAILVCAFIITAAGLLVRGVNRQAELARALRDANDRYHQTIDSVMDAIVAVDASHNILLFNPAAERMFGLAKQDVIGQPLPSWSPSACARLTSCTWTGSCAPKASPAPWRRTSKSPGCARTAPSSRSSPRSRRP